MESPSTRVVWIPLKGRVEQKLVNEETKLYTARCRNVYRTCHKGLTLLTLTMLLIWHRYKFLLELQPEKCEP